MSHGVQQSEPLYFLKFFYLKPYPLLKKFQMYFIPICSGSTELPQQTRHGPSLVNEVP